MSSEAESDDGKAAAGSGLQERPEFLRAFLAEHDEPCPACGYNLRGLTGQTCPECGEELRLRVGVVEPRLAHFIAGLVGLTMGFGFFAILHILMVLAFIKGSTVGWGDVLMVSGSTLVLGVATVWWIRRRRWMRRRPATQRRMLLAGAWALTVACVVPVFVFMV